MPRYFETISEKELKEKIDSLIGDDRYSFFHNLKLKIEVDFENTYYTKEDYDFSMVGINTLSNGLTYCGVMAFGDWELPVFFILYWDGKKIQAYVPTNGNVFNRTTKQAYGNDEDADLEDFKKYFPQFVHLLQPDDCIHNLEIDHNDYLIEQDIVKRIVKRS